MTTLAESPTRPTEGEIEAFTYGDCWVLANYLWKNLPGSQLIALAASEKNPEYEELNTVAVPWYHMAVLLQDGRIIDVEGVHSDQSAYMERWACMSECLDPEVYFHFVQDDREFQELTQDQCALYPKAHDRIPHIAEWIIAHL